VTLKELKSVMKSLGLSPTNDELKEMISSVDHNGDNEIDFDEFLILMRSRGGKKARNPEQELIDAFKVFDTDNSGSIDKYELKSLMDSLGQKLSSEELNAMMEEVDTDGNGEISYEEFKAMMVGD
jgi:Ca2+-binding EF-hand superfamily protein